jgi:hypothetical protein
MKKKQKKKLSIQDLQVKSFSASIRKEQSAFIVGGTGPTVGASCIPSTSASCIPSTTFGCTNSTDDTDSGTGSSQTACQACCGTGDTTRC